MDVWLAGLMHPWPERGDLMVEDGLQELESTTPALSEPIMPVNELPWTDVNGVDG